VIDYGTANKYLKYDTETGLFAWRISPGNRRRVGSKAGADVNGYVQIQLKGERYYAHRLAWLFIYGEFPKYEIDHIDHNRSNNRIDNLRSVNCQTNSRNARIPSNNTSGICGVRWCKSNSKWMAGIVINRKPFHLGYFKNIKDAAKAREEANIGYGFHPNHGMSPR